VVSHNKTRFYKDSWHNGKTLAEIFLYYTIWHLAKMQKLPELLQLEEIVWFIGGDFEVTWRLSGKDCWILLMLLSWVREMTELAGRLGERGFYQNPVQYNAKQTPCKEF
jgi:hypothetical protein